MEGGRKARAEFNSEGERGAPGATAGVEERFGEGEARQEGPGRRLSFIQHLMESGDGFLRFSQVVLVVKNPPANAGDVRDTGSIPGSGRSPAGEHGHPLQYSCPENPMDRGAWRATVHAV